MGREKYFNTMSGNFLGFVNYCPLALCLFLSCKLGVVDTKDCSKWFRKNFFLSCYVCLDVGFPGPVRGKCHCIMFNVKGKMM